MAINVSNVLMLLVQQIKRKQLVHITTLNMNHIKLACVCGNSCVVAFRKYKNRCFNGISA